MSKTESLEGVGTSTSVAATGTNRTLTSLAPGYDKDRHGTYLRHLEEQVANRKNLNIALTGRYGTGKSSILDRFEEKHREHTVRLGISTLDPASPNLALTNRLQKEIVKQLLYQAPAGKLRLSRFNRIATRDPWVAFGQSLLLVISVASVLAMPGWLPHLAGTGKGHPWVVSALVWAAFGLVLTGLVTATRLLILDRREVTDVSAGGASVKLTTKNETYFDEYLDEIVYFFDEISPKYVIFEDLDRFEDPHIFEALRELNTLLNSTQKRRKSKVPVQFIYAIKDSLFERLGDYTRQVVGDRAVAETRRANRTKFFEVVIPVVPFISHLNARELLLDELKDRGIEDIDRRLVDLVARHSTDMRLLHNICNEYLVFAERLLETKKVAPGLTPSKVFALVAYKNFHLEDFELIARRESTLDTLYDKSRELITYAISDAQKKKRDLTNARIRSGKMRPVAAILNDKLTRLASSMKAAPQWSGYSYHWFRVDGEPYVAAGPAEYTFWQAVAEAGELEILVSNSEKSNGIVVLTLDEADLRSLLPEALKAGQWDDVDAADARRNIAALDADIADLRGAGFVDLAREPRFISGSGEGAANFATIVDDTITSVLAQDLVKQGFVDRNFTLYAAQFYGHFSGVDVATFLVQNADTNTMEINYTFSGPPAIKNLLTEAPADFTSSVAAFNIAVLDYLLDEAPARAAEVVDHMRAGESLSHEGSDAALFLAAFLNSERGPERLAAALATRGWRDVFTYLASDESVPDDLRTSLVDAALKGAKPGIRYSLGEDVQDFIVENYSSLSAFTQAQANEVSKTVVALAAAADANIPDLAPLSESVRILVVAGRRYSLTAPNLRTALGIAGPVWLDQVLGHQTVREYCLAQPDLYIQAVEDDPDTPNSVEQSQVLVDVLTEVAEQWSESQIGRLLWAAAPSARLVQFTQVPQQSWAMLAESRMVIASLENLESYRSQVGSIDHSLAELLTQAEAISTVDGDAQPVRMTAAIAILSARDTLPSPELRVKLVASLDLDDCVDPAALTPETGPLLGQMLKGEIVEDAGAAFEAFKPAGWETLEAAIGESNAFAEFASPTVLSDFVPQALASSQVPERVKVRIIENLDAYVPGADEGALHAAGSFAARRSMVLSARDIEHIATGTQDPATVVSLLAAADLDAGTTVSVFSLLPAPYSHFATRAQSEFEVDDDGAHRKILGNLDSAGVATSTKVRRKDRRAVKLR